MKTQNVIVILACFFLICGLPLLAQQKGQWVPGQFGLNAGVIPDPGITYANLALNYSAGQLNDSNGNRFLQNVTGTYSFWVDENIAYYVPHHKFLGGYFMPYISVNIANGSLVADITGTNLSANGGGAGLADTYVEPLNMGWHFGKRVDFNAGYSFVAPTGRYTAGASNNVGSGYWGNDITPPHERPQSQPADLENGNMVFMMSKSAYLYDEGDHNGPHLFFTALKDGKDWGAGASGSPVVSGPYWFLSSKEPPEAKGLPPILVFGSRSCKVV